MTKPGPIPILMYHSISSEATPRFRRWTVPPERFAEQMAYLRSQGYTSLTTTQLAMAMLKPGHHLPVMPVVITFDDGFADFYNQAMPVLQRHGYAATVYVATGYVGGTSHWLYRDGEDRRQMLTWAELGDLVATGIECGAHGHHHLQLDTLPRAVAREEIVRSTTVLEDRLGTPITTFAYPHGYYDLTIQAMVQSAGHLSACGVKHALSGPGDDRFALARVIVDADVDLPRFAKYLSGEGLPVSPRGTRLRTRGWRLVRRSIALMSGSAASVASD